MGFVSERAVKCETKIGRHIIMFKPFHIYNDVRLLVNFGRSKVQSQRLQYSLILEMSALNMVLRSSNVRA